MPPRYAIPDQGLIYLSPVILSLIAAGFLLLRPIISWKKSPHEIIKISYEQLKNCGYLCYLGLLSPLPAALTLDDVPNVHRSLLLSVVWVFPVIYLLRAAFRERKFRYLSCIFACLMMAEVIYFSHQYFSHSSMYQSIVRNDDKRTLAKYVIDHKEQYRQIYLPMFDSMPVYYLFFSSNFDSTLAGQFQKGIFIDRVGPVTFIKENCPSLQLDLSIMDGSTMVVEKSECRTDLLPSELVSNIQRLNQTDAYRVYAPLGKNHLPDKNNR